MNRILITGSQGFVFSNIVLYLLQHTKYEIIGIDKLSYAGSLLNVPEVKRYKLYLGDVADYHFVKKVFEIEKPDIVIHGAAESHVDNSINGSREFVMTNVVGSHSILEAARVAHTPKKVIMISTDEVYGQILNGSFKESDARQPRNPYSATKCAADMLGYSYFSTYGLPIISVRPSNMFGPRQDLEKFVPKCIFNAKNDLKIPVYGRGEQVREWTYVKDFFHALIKIMEYGKPGESYNISSGVERKNIEIVEFILNELGKSKDLIEFVKDRLGHDFRYSVDCEKIKSLGWAPKYNLEEALRHYIKWTALNPWTFKDKQ